MIFNKSYIATMINTGDTSFPWRLTEQDDSFDPYKILVSELMLQQTQVARVIPKYQEFLTAFPSVLQLAQAPLGAVLSAWSGLGYNRRAKFLHQAAQMVVNDFGGVFPTRVSDLVRLPGVGSNTAGAIVAYAFNRPVVFIETNIRTVFIHHFFDDQTDISDVAILNCVKNMLDSEHPREWYWALMDYGSYLKQTVGNLNRASKSYARQSTFQGSKRQIRGQVIRFLTTKPYSSTELERLISDERLTIVLDELVSEGMIRRNKDQLTL